MMKTTKHLFEKGKDVWLMQRVESQLANVNGRMERKWVERICMMENTIQNGDTFYQQMWLKDLNLLLYESTLLNPQNGAMWVWAWWIWRFHRIAVTIWMHWIWIDSSVYDLSKSAMIVLDQWRHSKSTDWIDWKRSKSETIHLLK